MKIYRARRKQLGVGKRLPVTPDELIKMNEKFQKLPSGEKFLVSNAKLDEYSVVLVFMCEFGQRILTNSSHWFMDGTFSTVPETFSQLYTIFGSGGCGGKIFRVAYLLLPNKKGSTYDHAFYEIKNLLNYSPSAIFIDFESSACFGCCQSL